MSEESKSKERGLLTDIGIFIVIVGLALAAIYASGNWPWFLKTVANLEVEVRGFINTFTTNIQTVVDTVQNSPQM